MKFVKVRKKLQFKVNVETRKYLAPYNARLKVEVEDMIDRGEVLTEGSIDPKELISSQRCRYCSRVSVKRSSKSLPYARVLKSVISTLK